MTLQQIKTYIEGTAANQPNIHTIIKSGDIFDLNTLGDVKYGAFCCTQQPHQERDEWRTYRFYFFVVDRLLADQSNKIAVQSHAIDVLHNIISTIKNNDALEITDIITYTTFTQRFASECAGAYCMVNIDIPIADCNEEYE